MRKFTIAATILCSTCLTTAATADDDYRISEDPLELTIHMHWDRAKGYNEEYPVELAARELTGVHLKDATVGTNSPNHIEAFNLLIAGGEIPDIVGSQLIKQPVNEFGPQGAFLPLNDLIDEHAPNIKAFFDERPELQKAISAYDGNMYYIPYLPDGKYGRAYFIRQDWLDTLGLAQPQDVDALYDTLVAFRDQDPNGNGVKDEVPLFMRNWPELIRLVTLWDGRSSGSDTWHDFYVTDDGKVAHPYAQDNYRNGLANVAKWYDEGLIDQEVFTRGSSARTFFLSEDLGGMTHDWFASTSGYNSSLADEIEGFNFVPFLPPKSISGKRVEEHRRIPVKPDGWAIGHTNEHPIETIKYFDFWFTEEGRLLSNFGVEGDTWDMIDGEPVFKPEVLASDKAVNSQMWEVGAQIKKGYWQDYRYEWQWTAQAAREGIELYDSEDLLLDQFLGVAFSKDEQEVYDKLWPSIQTYMLERQQAWVLGNGDIHAEWDAYLETIDGMGFGDVIDVVNAAYARQYASN